MSSKVCGMAAGVLLLVGATVLVDCSGGPTPATPTKPALSTPAKPAVSTPAPAATPIPTKPVAPSTPTAAPATSNTPTAAPASTPKPAASGDATAGKAVFDTNCTACHPAGQKGVGPSLVGVVGRIGADGVTRQVRNGGGQMPAFTTSQISDTQLGNLIAYLSTLK